MRLAMATLAAYLLAGSSSFAQAHKHAEAFLCLSPRGANLLVEEVKGQVRNKKNFGTADYFLTDLRKALADYNGFLGGLHQVDCRKMHFEERDAFVLLQVERTTTIELRGSSLEFEVHSARRLGFSAGAADVWIVLVRALHAL